MTPKPSGLPQATPRGLTDLTPQEAWQASKYQRGPMPLNSEVYFPIFCAGFYAAEDERDRLAGRVEQRVIAENPLYKPERDLFMDGEAKALDRLQQATEALREAIAVEEARLKRVGGALAYKERLEAALAGEDEKPPDPQREGDYL